MVVVGALEFVKHTTGRRSVDILLATKIPDGAISQGLGRTVVLTLIGLQVVQG